MSPTRKRAGLGLRISQPAPFRAGLVVVLLALIALSLGAAESPPATDPAVRFGHVDVWLDTGAAPLGAYQFELAVEKGDAVIVGIEGGDHRAFKDPPYYDPAALTHRRVIIAAFSTDADLPTGKTRVARLMMQTRGEVPPQYAVRLDVAADRDGKRIAAKATVE